VARRAEGGRLVREKGSDDHKTKDPPQWGGPRKRTGKGLKGEKECCRRSGKRRELFDSLKKVGYGTLRGPSPRYSRGGEKGCIPK